MAAAGIPIYIGVSNGAVDGNMALQVGAMAVAAGGLLVGLSVVSRQVRNNMFKNTFVNRMCGFAEEYMRCKWGSCVLTNLHEEGVL